MVEIQYIRHSQRDGRNSLWSKYITSSHGKS